MRSASATAKKDFKELIVVVSIYREKLGNNPDRKFEIINDSFILSFSTPAFEIWPI